MTPMEVRVALTTGYLEEMREEEKWIGGVTREAWRLKFMA